VVDIEDKGEVKPNRHCPTPSGLGMKACRAREPARTMAVREGEHPAKAAAGCSRALPSVNG
jgi:hypothetical protein